MKDFSKFIVETNNQQDYFLSSLLSTLQVINLIAGVDSSSLNPFFYLDVKDSEKLRIFSEQLLHSSIFLTCRFFDLSYSIDIHGKTKLSSGEYEMLNLLSRIYWYLTIEVRKFTNLSVPALLFLDEAEIGFHPEWQRKYLHIITIFIKKFFNIQISRGAENSRKIQIIYTTHSPITLGDLPKECVVFLEKKNNKVYNRSLEMPQTFAQNVFELYRNSFFMTEGLLGKKAEEYIKDISCTLQQKSDYRQTNYTNSELIKRINLIGDRYIRTYLLEKYAYQVDREDIDSQIRLKEEELARLKQLKMKRQTRNEEN